MHKLENSITPIYKTPYKDTDIAFYLSRYGACI